MLAHDDNAAGPYQPAIGQIAQLRGRVQAHPCKLRAQQQNRVAAQRQAERGVVKEHLFALRCRGQVQYRFIHRHTFEQHRRGRQGGSVPDLLAPVA